MGNEVLHETICSRAPGAPEVEGPLSPQSSFIFLDVQTMMTNCKESLLSNYSCLTLHKNGYLLFYLLGPFTYAFLPPEMPFLTPLPIQFLTYFKASFKLCLL